MKRAIGKLVAVVALGSGAAQGCGPEFETCQAKHTCAPGGRGGEAGADGTGMGGAGAGAGGSRSDDGGGASSGDAGGVGGDGSEPGGASGNVAGAAGATTGGTDSVGGGGHGATEGGSAGAGGAPTDPCERNPCENHGTCAVQSGEARCQCGPGFTGERCELARFELIPLLEGDTLGSATGVSDDGSVVVGYSSGTTSSNRAFRWEKGATRDLGRLSGDTSATAIGVSGDGSVVVGNSRSAAGSRGFRWQAGAMKALSPLPGDTWCSAEAVSTNGSTIVGYSGTGASRRAVRWLSNAAEDLQLIGPSLATGTNDNGEVIVGIGANGAFRWDNGSSEPLAVPSTGDANCEARSVSGNGLAIVGYCSRLVDNSFQTVSYAWSNAGLEPLGLPTPGLADPPTVQIVSANYDGSAAVGFAWINADTGESRALLWNPRDGMRWLSSALRSSGVDLGEIVLGTANAISGNGKTTVGQGGPAGGSSQGWIARMP